MVHCPIHKDVIDDGNGRNLWLNQRNCPLHSKGPDLESIHEFDDSEDVDNL
jgi:hypothetical protein